MSGEARLLGSAMFPGGCFLLDFALLVCPARSIEVSRTTMQMGVLGDTLAAARSAHGEKEQTNGGDCRVDRAAKESERDSSSQLTVERVDAAERSILPRLTVSNVA